MLTSIKIWYDDTGITYELGYEDGEVVKLHCLSDLIHYLEANENGTEP